MPRTQKAILTCLGSLTVLTGSAIAQPTSFNEIFKAPISLPAGMRPYDVKVGDFNGDSEPDIVVANRGFSGSGSISVYLADPSGGPFGHFIKQRNDLKPLGMVEPVTMQVYDLDSNGAVDLVVADATADGVFIFMNKIGSGFDQDTAQFFQTGNSPVGLSITQINGNGNLDVAVVSFDDNKLWSLVGDGVGGFAPAVSTPTINNPRVVFPVTLGISEQRHNPPI